jgi:hypothetical protein
MQTIFKSTENQQQVPATSIANDSNNMLTTNYHFRDTSYRVKIKLEYGLYICNSKDPHIVQNPVQCQEGHLFCYKCSVVVPQVNGVDKKACPDCYLSSQSKVIDNHSEECFKLNKDFCVERIINNIPINCPTKETFNLNNDSLCNWQGNLKDLEDHLGKDCKILPQTEVIQNRLSELEQQITKANTNTSILEKLTEKINSQQQEIVDLKQQSSQQRQNITKLKKQINEIISIRNINNKNFGELVWKIDNYKKKLDMAKKGIQIAICSPSFYSKQYGYHLKTKIYLNGDDLGKGEYLSVYILVCKGEFDNILKWPLNCRITFTLINQEPDKDDYIKCFNTDINSSSFQKPINSSNIAMGSPIFLQHKTIEHGGFIKADTIFLKTNVVLNNQDNANN